MKSTKLNQCPIHPKKLQTTICISCKRLSCIECFEEVHANKKSHKYFGFLSKFTEKYKFEKYLGSGTSGYVFSILDPIENKKYALKFVDDINEDEGISTVYKNIANFKRIDNTNFIHVFSGDYLANEERMVLLMELADETLKDVMLRNDLDEETTIKYFRDICNGLKYLHQHNYIHKNLKPENILIINGIAKLSEFGINKKNHRNMFNFIENDNLFGNLSYFAPEIMKNDIFNEKCDTWAIGVIFYQMLIYGSPSTKSESKEIKEKNEEKLMSSSIITHPKAKKYEKIIQGLIL